MDKSLEKYLEQVDQHLKPLPPSERIDIVKEIKSTMIEMQQDHLTSEQILKKLEDPKSMAKAYLGNLLSKTRGFNKNKYLTTLAFYSLTGFTGMFVIPVLGILAPVFYFCGLLIPILGSVKLLGYLLHFNVPFIVFNLGPITLHAIPSFFLSILVGAIFYFLGSGTWRLLLRYIHSVIRKKKELLD